VYIKIKLQGFKQTVSITVRTRTVVTSFTVVFRVH